MKGFPFAGPRNKRELLTKKEREEQYSAQANCAVCDEPLTRPTIKDSVRDHCHITGEYRSAAHAACNMNYFRLNPKRVTIPVVFHNLRGYDAHHIMTAIAEIQAELECVPSNMEKYISFSLGNLRFIDSFQFIPSSLDNLVKSSQPTQSFTYTSEH